MFEYTLIMAICSASATANYAHEMAYYWAHTVAHTHTHTARWTDRQTVGLADSWTRIGIQLGVGLGKSARQMALKGHFHLALNEAAAATTQTQSHFGKQKLALFTQRTD